MVALLLQRWLNYRGLLSAAKMEGENKESPIELFFFQYQRQNIKTIKVTTRPSTQSVQRSHNDFLRPMKHDLAADLAASDEVATWKAWELARICFQSFCMILWSDRALSLLDSFSSSYLFECPSKVFVWILESIYIVEQIDEDNYLLTV